MKTNIYVAYHKPFLMLPCKCFIPIQLGRDTATEELPMIGDNTGDNISRLRNQFCESTAEYWAWKNDHDCDYIGLFHYRRLFAFKTEFDSNSNDICAQLGLEEETINNYVKDYDIVLPYACTIGNFYEHSAVAFTPEIMDRMFEIIKEIRPEYANAVERTRNLPAAYYYNLFIMRRDLYEDYCDFKFKTLLKLEDEIINKETNEILHPALKELVGTRDGTSYYPRLVGILGERMINFYIEYLKEQGPLRIGVLPPVMVKPSHEEGTYGFHIGCFH